MSFCLQHSWLKAAKQTKFIASHAVIAAAAWLCPGCADFSRAVPATWPLLASGPPSVPTAGPLPAWSQPHGCSWRWNGPRQHGPPVPLEKKRTSSLRQERGLVPLGGGPSWPAGTELGGLLGKGLCHWQEASAAPLVQGLVGFPGRGQCHSRAWCGLARPCGASLASAQLPVQKPEARELFTSFPILKCVFTEAYPALLSGLTGCQSSKLAS